MSKIRLLSGLTVVAVLLSACGQSGELMLPSNPNYDKRPKYMIYKGNRTEQTVSSASAEVPASIDITTK